MLAIYTVIPLASKKWETIHFTHPINPNRSWFHSIPGFLTSREVHFGEAVGPLLNFGSTKQNLFCLAEASKFGSSSKLGVMSATNQDRRNAGPNKGNEQKHNDKKRIEQIRQFGHASIIVEC